MQKLRERPHGVSAAALAIGKAVAVVDEISIVIILELDFIINILKIIYPFLFLEWPIQSQYWWDGRHEGYKNWQV